jgi:hypothetical protein
MKDLIVTGRIRTVEIFGDFVRNRTHDLPACNTVS